MSSLKTEPPQPVQSIGELLAIAQAMEHAAATRYAEIAQRLRSDGNSSLAEVFEHLAAEERRHLADVTHWSEKESGRAPDPSLIRWTIPETFDDEGAATTDARLMSAYRALSMAVRNEERTFAFWTYVVAHALDKAVRRAAETMAEEELDHVATLRRERRQAYHAERIAAADQPMIENDCAELELRLADRLDARAEAVRSDNAAILRRLAAEARATSNELVREPIGLAHRAVSQSILDDPVALSELLVDRYLEAAERLPAEQAVLRAQALARRALTRLTWLRADAPQLRRTGQASSAPPAPVAPP